MAQPAEKENDSPAGPTRTYEVQRHAQGRWIVDTVSDDKEMAIECAKNLMAGRRPPSGVRVMSVMLSDTGKFSEISVFRSTMADQGREAAPASRPKVEAKPKTPTESRDFKHSGQGAAAVAKKRPLRNLFFALQIAFGLGVTLAAAEALYLMMR
jgi:hypothetical protein